MKYLYFKIYLSLFFVFLITSTINAQTFEEVIGTPFEGVIRGFTAFSDIDNDGDQDVLITGLSSSGTRIAKLYTNDGTGAFTEVIGTPFEGVYFSSIAFSDIDNDGDQDVLITGENSSGTRIAKLYTNDGTGTFTEVAGTPFDGVSYSSIAFSDIDNDGDQDVLITGFNSSYQRIAKLYTNDGTGTFTEVAGTPFDGVSVSSIAFSDIDNDGDQDVLITGFNSSYQRIAKLYTNDGTGTFTEVAGTPFDGVSYSSIAFSDMDNDGDQDVLITGYNSSKQRIAKLYTNDGTGTFTEVAGTPFDGVSYSSIAFSDMDNDGDQDVLITGYNSSKQRIAKLYTNDGTGAFTEVTGTPFDGVFHGSIAFSDIDNDGNQDVLITGLSSSGTRIAKLYRITTIGDTPPTAGCQDITIALDASGNVTILPSAADNGSSDAEGPVSLSLDIDTFDCSNIGSNTVTLTVTDTAENTATCSFTVTVTDTELPIARTQDIEVTLDEFGDVTITANEIDNGSSDNCGIDTMVLDITTFDCTNIGENTVTLTVTDVNGNVSSTETATVTVLEYFKPTLDLRSLSSFEAFTGTGAITNAGTVTGDVGTNAGALTGFTGPSFTGAVHLNDALTAQAAIDLMKVYIHLNNIFVTHPGTHAPAFGNETLSPGVYAIGGAGSVAGNLTLDGGGDPDAVFIFKFQGALTVGAGSKIILSGGTQAANVFFIAQGALSVAASCDIKGTLVAYPGAITLGASSSIEGRMLSSAGAITVGAGGAAITPGGTMNVPINPMKGYTPAPEVDVLGSLENFSLFSSIGAVANASTSGILGDVGADIGAISGFATSAHIGSFYNTDAVTTQAKIDLDNAYNQLMLLPPTVSNHTPAFGSGETLQAGVYTTPGAGSLSGTITLDGQGNEDAIFIFKFGGAFAAGALSKMILSNGTRGCNVFWISEGAVSIGAFSTIKGTILAHGGAATMAAGGNLEGRLLSTGGAIGFSTGVVYTVVHDVECVYPLSQKTSGKKMAASAPASIINNLLIYPNPSNGVFKIKLKNTNIAAQLLLFDVLGKLIERRDVSAAQAAQPILMDKSSVETGVYLLKIITKDEIVTKKIVIKRE